MSGISDIYWNLNSNLPRPSAPCSGQFSLVNHYAGDGHDLHMMPAVNMHQTALSALLRPNRAWVSGVHEYVTFHVFIICLDY